MSYGGHGSSLPPWRVFLSHTSELRRLPAGRSFVNAAESAVIRLGHVPVDMDYFPAEDNDPAQMCRRRVTDCDVYVGIIGFLYGTAVPGMNVSYTEFEFDTASDLGMERLIFVLDPDRTEGPRSLLVDKHFGDRQDAFRERVQTAGLTVKKVTSPDELDTQLSHALGQLRQRLDAAAQVTSGSAPAWLPQPPDPVVDRPALVRRLTDFVIAPGAGVVAVHGAGGFGKSTLAMTVASRDEVRTRFPGGVLWADVGQDLTGVRLADMINGLSRRLGEEKVGPSDPTQAGMR
nr:DUF4062 domain-containing protein [Micromonospora sp. DSM 115978]